MPEISVENVTGPVAYHAEGPVWWPGWGGLRYVDMLAGDLLTLRPDGGVDGFVVANGTSANRHNGADLEHTRRTLGYAPVDDAWDERTRDVSA